MEKAPLFVIGFFFGMVLWQVCVRVLVSLTSLILGRDLHDVKLTPPMDRRQWMWLAFFATGAGTWIGGIGFWSYREHIASAVWAAFLAGVAAAPFLTAFLAAVAICRQRKRASNATP